MIGRKILSGLDSDSRMHLYIDAAPELAESNAKLDHLLEKLKETLVAKGYGKLVQSNQVNRVKFFMCKMFE